MAKGCRTRRLNRAPGGAHRYYGVTTKYLASLGMPLVKTVTRAGPSGKLFSRIEVKPVSDQPVAGSAKSDMTWLLAMLRSCTTGKFAEESWKLPPEACEMP